MKTAAELITPNLSNSSYLSNINQTYMLRKYRIIKETYGFKSDSWEAETTPISESFCHLKNSSVADMWLKNDQFSLKPGQ